MTPVAAALAAVPAEVRAAIPSPVRGVWHLGPFPVRAYAVCILIGIALAVYIADRRVVARGGPPGVALDVSAWAVPFGVVGARLYHVVTSPQAYFGRGGHALDALKIWQGGLGIWGAVALGALGAYIGCRRAGLSFSLFADAAAPGVAVAQAAGRVGNWFNNEIYGRRTDLPWGLQVHEWDTSAGAAVRNASGAPVLLPGTYHPTFLYEALWCLLVALIVVLADRRFRLDHGRTFALYVILYTLGRFWFETLRVDPANLILGHRLNEWTSVLVFVLALALFVRGSVVSRRTSRNADNMTTKQDV
ncbi:MAG TPA: prolipoprotein diacylglyceryl transferase [Actinomycetales bacterium]|nr:prolipoprotein diacylglyceryl transferase [Actinomycetales bacterium]